MERHIGQKYPCLNAFRTRTLNASGKRINMQRVQTVNVFGKRVNMQRVQGTCLHAMCAENAFTSKACRKCVYK